MKINEKNKDLIFIQACDYGEVIYYKKTLCIVTTKEEHTETTSLIVCVALESGKFISIPWDTKVEKVNCEVNVL